MLGLCAKFIYTYVHTLEQWYGAVRCDVRFIFCHSYYYYVLDDTLATPYTHSGAGAVRGRRQGQLVLWVVSSHLL